MILRARVAANEKGAAAIEMAFALPILVVMIWMFFQLAQVYRALAGIQMALGEGARYATLCVNPTALGCGAPTAAQVKAKIDATMYGVGSGTYTVADPVSGSSGTANYYDLTVNYTQPTSLLLVPGPTINLGRSKRVWVATSA